MRRRKFFKLVLSGGALVMMPVNRIFSKSLLTGPEPSGLESGFADPPDSARPHTWWHWMNGNVTREGIDLDLEAMKRVGLGGFQQFDVACGIPHGPVDYDSEEWHDLLRHAMQKADSLGLKMCFHNCPGWSSSGGPWINPEHSMKKLVWSEVQVNGTTPDAADIRLPQPETVQDYYRDIAVMAFPTPKSEGEGGEGFRLDGWRFKAGHKYEGSMIEYRRYDRPAHDTREGIPEEFIDAGQLSDVTAMLRKNGRLDWKAPEGHWTVVRFGHTITGKMNHPAPEEAVGLECDKLSREGAEAHWNGIVRKVLDSAGPLAGKTLDSILIDSYEAGAQNWTKTFPEEFRQRRGYDLMLYLPCLTGRVMDSVEKSERFLFDFRRTIADLFVDNYYGHFASMCHGNGLKLYMQPYGRIGNFDEFSNASKADVPMGEFWVNRYDFGMAYASKMAASSAHALGKKYVASETFTAGRKEATWFSHPYSLKAYGDYFFCQGINKYIFHEFAHQPWPELKPGMTMGPFGFQMNRGNTWWEQSSAWLTYLSRTQHMLQEGRFVADLCYYFGENVPNALVNRNELEPVPPAGYDYDAFVTDVLMQMEVEDEELVLPSGMRYRVLVLPHFERMISIEVLQKVRDLVYAGATVVGPRPVKAPGLSGYPGCDAKVRDLAAEVWGDTNGRDRTLHEYGKGRVYWGAGLAQVYFDMGLVPDFKYTGEDSPGLECIHRRTDHEDLYFISNQEHRMVRAECTFRVWGKVPELWDPMTGQTRKAGVYRDLGSQVRVPLLLEPAGSVFVVFREAADGRVYVTDAQHNGEDIRSLKVLDPQPELEILEARYGILDDASRQRDVTRELANMIEDNYLRVIPGRVISHDPAPDSWKQFQSKQLYVKYSFGGKTRENTVDESGQLVLPDQPGVQALPAAELWYSGEGTIQLNAWREGDYRLDMSDGSRKMVRIENVTEPLAIDGPWTLKFPSGWGAPEKTTLDELIPWNENTQPGIKHFSGTAGYEKILNIRKSLLRPEHMLWLDLGRVYVIAEVWLNGEQLGILWKPPFRVNVTGAMQAGENSLEVKVTNLWPNRMIGDETKPDPRPFEYNQRWRAVLPVDWETWQELAEKEKQQPGNFNKLSGRYAWSTMKYYGPDDPLFESGMLGPVRIITQVIKNVT